jgi:hypothetical protein
MSTNGGVDVAALVKARNELKAHIEAQTKRFDDYIKSFRQNVEEIDNQLLAWLNSNKLDKFSCDDGTVYKSHIMNIKIENREALFDLIADTWEEWGNEALLINAQKDAVKRWMDEHEGKPPAGVTTGWITRVNVRRS